MSKRRDGLSQHTCRPASGVHHGAKIKNTASIRPGVSHHYSIKERFCHISILHSAVVALMNNAHVPSPNTAHFWQQHNHLRCRLPSRRTSIPKETSNNSHCNDLAVHHRKGCKVFIPWTGRYVLGLSIKMASQFISLMYLADRPLFSSVCSTVIQFYLIWFIWQPSSACEIDLNVVHFRKTISG